MNQGETLGPSTRFSLDLGLSADWPTESAWALRLEMTETLYPVPGFVLSQSERRPLEGGGSAQASIEVPANVRDTWQAAAGLRYRFGAVNRSQGGLADTRRRWMAGPQVGYSILSEMGLLSTRRTPAVGGFVSYRLLDWLDADGSLALHPQAPEVRSELEGGALLQVLGGVKVGRRRAGVGTFVKARVGVNSYSGAIKLVDPVLRTKELTRVTAPAVDVGGALEVALARRAVFRLDASEIVALRGLRDHDRNSISISSGMGWRF